MRNKGSHLSFSLQGIVLRSVRSARRNRSCTTPARPCRVTLTSMLSPNAYRRSPVRFAGVVTAALSLACSGAALDRAAGQATQPTAIQLTLDRPLDASDASFVLASSRGLFRSENIAVT